MYIRDKYYFSDINHNMSRDMTKPAKWVCAQRRLRSAWASVWLESSLCVQWVAKDPSFLHADSEDWSDLEDAQADPSLRWAHSHFVVFVMSWLNNEHNGSCAKPRSYLKASLSLILAYCVHTLMNMSCDMTKPIKWHVRPAKYQISLGIRPVWSESSLSTSRKLGSLATHWAHSEDWSDWADAQADLSFCWAHSHFVGFVMRRLISVCCSCHSNGT